MVLMSAALGTEAGMMLLTSMRRKYQLRMAGRLCVLPISRRMRKRSVRERRSEERRVVVLRRRVASLSCECVRGGFGLGEVAVVEVGGEVERWVRLNMCMMVYWEGR